MCIYTSDTLQPVRSSHTRAYTNTHTHTHTHTHSLTHTHIHTHSDKTCSSVGFAVPSRNCKRFLHHSAVNWELRKVNHTIFSTFFSSDEEREREKKEGNKPTDALQTSVAWESQGGMRGRSNEVARTDSGWAEMWAEIRRLRRVSGSLKGNRI